MSFPAAPTNGQTHTEGATSYTYNSAANAWVRNAAAAGVQAYTHTQAVASTSWTINHSLGFNPAGITVSDGAGNEVMPNDISHPTVNQTVLSFLVAQAGTARLS
jgi:hypothetical protein